MRKKYELTFLHHVHEQSNVKLMATTNSKTDEIYENSNIFTRLFCHFSGAHLIVDKYTGIMSVVLSLCCY